MKRKFSFISSDVDGPVTANPTSSSWDQVRQRFQIIEQNDRVTEFNGPPQMASIPAASDSVPPSVAGNQGPPQTESIQESSAFLPQQQAETIDGSSPNESVERDYEKVIEERDNFERMATLYKNQLHSSRCLLKLAFSGVFHAIDASPLCAQKGVATSDRPGMHPFTSSLNTFLRINNTWENAETALDSNKSRKEKHKLCLEIMEQFKSFMLSYPGMAEIQAVEPTFKQQAETTEQPSTPGTIKQSSVPTSNDAPMIQATAVGSTPRTIKQTSVPASNDAPMIQANAVGSTPGTIKQSSVPASNDASMIQANAVGSTPGTIKHTSAPTIQANAVAFTDEFKIQANFLVGANQPPQTKPATKKFRTEKEKTRAIQQILHKLMPVGVSLEKNKDHYAELQKALTQPRTEQRAELPGGMTIRQRVSKSVIDADRSMGAEWVRKAKTLLAKYGNEEDLHRLLFLVERHLKYTEGHPGLALAEVFGKESRDDDDEVEVIDPPPQAKAPVWDLENPSEVAQYLSGDPRTDIRIKKEVPSPTKIAGFFEQIQLDSNSTHNVL
ncbi:hypothetical protein IV203_009639 [Nitzschia inconspicua]|uniref:Uncharacterized protein n=1 Tax=Nitzschia inconspicua TaxID=303405 RepID=A0A9K3PMC2_9STRA|nr:hypothetical protein IV203_009639 [Nitzschia inconspicua]